MQYFISLTDLHSALIRAIADEGSVLIEFPSRERKLRKLQELPRLVTALWRIARDNESHVHVSHPFTWLTALASRFSSTLSFFDDGVAYYGRSPLEWGARHHIMHFLTRRNLDWRAISNISSPTYADALLHSRIESFYAIFPDLIKAGSFTVKQVDLQKAFPQRQSSARDGGVALFLDTRNDSLPDVSREDVIAILRNVADSHPSGKLLYKPHPSEASAISVALRDAPWAMELSGSLEESLASMDVSSVYSFFSSGAISVKLVHRDARVICLIAPGQQVADGTKRLFARVSATTVVVGDEQSD